MRAARERSPALRLQHAQTESLDPGIFGGHLTWSRCGKRWSTRSIRWHRCALPRGRLSGGTLAISVPNVRNVLGPGPILLYAYGGITAPDTSCFRPTPQRALREAGFDLVHLNTEFGTDWRQVLHLRQQFDRSIAIRTWSRAGR